MTSTLPLNLEALTHFNSLVEAFRAFDSDNNGLINTVELQGLLTSLGHDTGEQEAKDIIIEHTSPNQNNQLSITDFLDIMDVDELDLDGLGDLFHALIPALGPCGPNGNNLVDGEELAKVMSMVGNANLEDCMEIISCLDCDGDGEINIEEIKLMASLL